MYTLLWSVDTVFSHAAAMASILGSLVCRILYATGHVIHHAWFSEVSLALLGMDVYQIVDISGCKGSCGFSCWMLL